MHSSGAGGPLPGQVALRGDPRVLATLHAIGRTEDVRIRRDGHLAVIAGFLDGTLTFLDLPRGDGMQVGAVVTLGAPGLGLPHGIEFVSDDVIVVADREAGLLFFTLVPGAGGVLPAALDPLPVTGQDLPEFEMAGSVAAVGAATPAGVTLAVCDGPRHRVAMLSARLTGDEVVVQSLPALRCTWLGHPDGVAASADGEWIAVSAHWTQVIAMLRRGERGYTPAGVLRGPAFPHGVRFAAGGHHVVVADGGTPYVFVFASDGTWDGTRYPAGRLRVTDDACFVRGATSPQEGGPKGVELTPDGRLLLVTSEQQPLAAFSIDAVHAAPAPDPWDVDRRVLEASSTLMDAVHALTAEHRAAATYARDLEATIAEKEAALHRMGADVRALPALQARLDEVARDRDRASRAYEETVSAHRGLMGRHDELVAAHRGAEEALARRVPLTTRARMLAGRLRRRGTRGS